jgi:ABC-type Zn uptake system ZnuABC Zn-binding protein ZnuA
LGGEEVTVRALVPPTVSPSKYQLKPVDIRTVSGYDVFLYATWETWAKKIIAALHGGKVRIDRVKIDTGGIWGDPVQAKAIAQRVADRLISALPEQRAIFAVGLARFQQTIDTAHQQARERLAQHRGAKVIVCQNGLRFFVRSVGLEIVAQLVEKEREMGLAAAVSPRRVAEIIERGKQRGARLLIYAPQLGLERTCGVIEREVGIPRVKIPLMPGSVPGATTYQTMLLEAAARIKRALEAR